MRPPPFTVRIREVRRLEPPRGRGRPPRPVCAVGVAMLRRCGRSWRDIAQITGCGTATVMRHQESPAGRPKIPPRLSARLGVVRWGADALASLGGERWGQP